jgi:hypothetical protein
MDKVFFLLQSVQTAFVVHPDFPIIGDGGSFTGSKAVEM